MACSHRVLARQAKQVHISLRASWFPTGAYVGPFFHRSNLYLEHPLGSAVTSILNSWHCLWFILLSRYMYPCHTSHWVTTWMEWVMHTVMVMSSNLLLWVVSSTWTLPWDMHAIWLKLQCCLWVVSIEGIATSWLQYLPNSKTSNHSSNKDHPVQKRNNEQWKPHALITCNSMDMRVIWLIWDKVHT